MDPEEYRAKLRSLGFVGKPQRGTTRTTPVVDDDTGRRVGHHTEHWSGRVDATATGVRAVPNPAVTQALRNKAHAESDR